MMKRFVYLFVLSMICVAPCLGDEGRSSDPNQLFYQANAYYQTGSYEKAVETYEAILKTSLASGRLYYNIGNAYLKLGRVGRAILNYERARRLIPRDGDLGSNLAYARSLVGDAAFEAPSGRLVTRIIKRPFKDFNLNALAVSGAFLYLAVIAFLAASIKWPFIAKKVRAPFYVILIISLLNLAAFALRYYDEHIVKRAVILEKNVECKYEPIDKATTYYTLSEGADVVVLKCKPPWCQIKRFDGKIAWVRAEAVGQI